MKIFIVTLLNILICTVSFIAQETNDEENFKKGEEIMKMSRDAIYQKTKMSEVKALSLKTLYKIYSHEEIPNRKDADGETYTLEVEENNTREKTFSIEGSEKVRIFELQKEHDDRGSKKLSIFSNDRIYAKWEILKEGEYLDQDEYFKQSGIKRDDSYKDHLKKFHFFSEIWDDVFPLVLFNSLDNSIKFKYLGKAKAPTGKADIIQLVSTQRSSEVVTKLFFDEKTHLLLMMTDFYEKKGYKKTLKKSYYSNNILVDGVLVPQTIKTEERNKNFSSEDVLLSETKTLEEITVTEFKINPKFDSKEFEIKEDKAKKTKP